MIKKSRDHLDSVNESYLQHMGFALGMAMAMAAGAVLVSLHAVCPAIFQYSGSSRILKLAKRIEERRKKSSATH